MLIHFSALGTAVVMTKVSMVNSIACQISGKCWKGRTNHKELLFLSLSECSKALWQIYSKVQIDSPLKCHSWCNWKSEGKSISWLFLLGIWIELSKPQSKPLGWYFTVLINGWPLNCSKKLELSPSFCCRVVDGWLRNALDIGSKNVITGINLR